MTDLNLVFAKIEATNDDQQMVFGVASTDTPDAQGGEIDGQRYEGDIVAPAALAEALPDYLAWANIREMHQPSAVGRAVQAEMQDGKLMLAARVVDAEAWKKVKENIYQGFSIGGKVLAAKLIELEGKVYRLITKIRLYEISLVDRPANPDARILMWKAEGDWPQIKGGSVDEEKKLPVEGEKEAGAEAPPESQPAADKTGAAVIKIVKQLQGLRDECELNNDLAGAGRYNRAISALVGQESEAVEIEGEAMMMSQPAGDMQKVEGQPGVVLIRADMADDLMKAITPQFDALLTKLDDVTQRLAVIEAQPAPGGPALRPVEKPITPLPGATPRTAGRISKSQLDELKQKANTEPNPALRGQYQQQYTAALEQLI